MQLSREARELAALLRMSHELDVVGDVTASVDSPSELLAWAAVLVSPDVVAWVAQDSGHRFLQVTAKHHRAPVHGRVTAVLDGDDHPEFWSALGLQALEPGTVKHLRVADLSSAWSAAPAAESGAASARPS